MAVHLWQSPRGVRANTVPYGKKGQIVVELRGFPALLTATLQGQIAVTGTSGLQSHSFWIHAPFREGLPSRGNLVAGCGGIRVGFVLFGPYLIRTVVHVPTLPPMIKQAQWRGGLSPPSRLRPCMNWMMAETASAFCCPGCSARCRVAAMAQAWG